MARFPFPMPRSNRPRRPGPRRVGLVGAIALLIAALASGLSQCQGTAANPTSTAKPSAQTVALRVSDKPPERYEAIDGPAITARDEVRGIWDTLRRVANGPPFPYRQDGVVFQNREKRLAKRESGWWREYTVETPGSSDRGARRLVVGKDGEVWYTPDHYRTFVRIVP
jgi:ribonuclease T1